MMKEVALFAVASSALVYFLSPTSEKPSAVPEEIMDEVERLQPPAQKVDDSWDYEDDSEDENFVFGEPLKLDDEDSNSEDEAEALKEISKIKKVQEASKDQGISSVESRFGSAAERTRRTKNNPALQEIR